MHHVRSQLSPYSRLLLCQRVAADRPVAHVAAEMGVSRQTAHRWVTRFATEGGPGLTDRSSRPARVHRGADLRRHQVPLLRDLDRLTGIPVRARSSELRYEREHPGDLVHADVKKLGRIRRRRRLAGPRPQRRHPRPPAGLHTSTPQSMTTPAPPTPRSCPTRRERPPPGSCSARPPGSPPAASPTSGVITDNACAYPHSTAWRDTMALLGATSSSACTARTNGKVERFNRTLLTEWAYQRPYTSTAQRTLALHHWLNHYNTERPHTALGGHTPTHRPPSTTS